PGQYFLFLHDLSNVNTISQFSSRFFFGGPKIQNCPYFRPMTNQKAVAEKLLQAGAVKLRPHEPFPWATGWKSPIYCDNRRGLSFPFIRDFIKSELCNGIFEHLPAAELLAGV